MAFGSFRSIADVQRRYNIIYRDGQFVEPVALAPSPAFLADYEFSTTYMDVLISETSRCESIIFPVLKDIFRHYVDHLSLWSHPTLTADADLSGVPDYVIATRSPLGKTVLEQPLLVVVEAKKSDFEWGWGQCLAGMVAAQRINSSQSIPVYGIVTDGQLWQFGRLVDNTFTFEKNAVTTADLEQLFASINFLLQQAVASLTVAV